VKLLFIGRRWNGEKETTLEEMLSVSSQNDLNFGSTVSDMHALSEGKSFWYPNVSSVLCRKIVVQFEAI
jgi:hypothetical protein